MSLGAATYDPREPTSLHQLIEQADKAMYEDKRRHHRTREQMYGKQT